MPAKTEPDILSNYFSTVTGELFLSTRRGIQVKEHRSMTAFQLSERTRWVLIITGGVAIILVLASFLGAEVRAVYEVVTGILGIALMIIAGYTGWEIARYFNLKNRSPNGGTPNPSGSGSNQSLEQTVKQTVARTVDPLRKDVAAIREHLGLPGNPAGGSASRKKTASPRRKS